MKAVILQGPPAWAGYEDNEITEYMKTRLASITEIESCSFLNRDLSTAEQIDEAIGDADILLGYRFQAGNITEEFFQRHKNLKYMATLAMGYGEFDKELTRRHHVIMTNTLYGSNTIAQYTFALLLEICHRVEANSHFIKTGNWSDPALRPAYMQAQTPQLELYNKTMGIFGLGNIGLWVAKMAHAFGMKIIACSRSKKAGPQYEFIRQVSKEELLAEADVISLHLPITSATHGIINKDTISQMKDGVILLNTARGALINEEDLYAALISGKVYAAGLDCLQTEPATVHTPLMDCPNAVVTGHIAWYPRESRLRNIDIAIENLKAYLRGEPKSVVN